MLAFLGVLLADGQVYMVCPFVENGALPDYLEKHPDVDRIPIVSIYILYGPHC